MLPLALGPASPGHSMEDTSETRDDAVALRDAVDGMDEAAATPLFRFNPRFKDARRERRFRRDFFVVWRRAFQVTYTVITALFVLVVLFYFAVVVPRDYQFVSAFFGDRVALGEELAYANMLTPCIGVLGCVAVFTRLYTERSHVLLLALMSFGNFFAYGWGVHIRDLTDEQPWLSRPPPNCTEDLVPDLVGKIVLRSTVHIALALVADVAVVILCPSLLATVAIVVAQHATHLAKVAEACMGMYRHAWACMGHAWACIGMPVTHLAKANPQPALPPDEPAPPPPVALPHLWARLATYGPSTTRLTSPPSWSPTIAHLQRWRSSPHTSDVARSASSGSCVSCSPGPTR